MNSSPLMQTLKFLVKLVLYSALILFALLTVIYVYVAATSGGLIWDARLFLLANAPIFIAGFIWLPIWAILVIVSTIAYYYKTKSKISDKN